MRRTSVSFKRVEPVRKARLARLAMAMLAVVLVAASCGAKGDSVAEGGVAAPAPPATTPEGDSEANFGDLEAPCGPGEGKIEESEAGSKGSDKLYIGVNSDKGADIRPGLLREFWDSSNAYIDWCNEQGGIAGLQIEPVDLDGELFNVQQYLPTACNDVFAMVGGGSTFDNLQLEGPGNLEECGQLDIPGFTVTKAKAEATDTYIAAVPNPSDARPAAFFEYLAQEYPDAGSDIASVYGDLDTIRFVKDQTNAVIDKMGPPLEVGDDIAYAAQGQDFKLTSQSLKGSGATMGTFIGEPSNFGLLLSSMKEDGVDIPMFVEANNYDPLLLEKGSNPAGEVLIRLPHPPFEEADEYPAVQKFEELMDARKAKDDQTKTAALGIQSMSAWLLFTEAATACAEQDGNIISRDCVQEQIGEIGEWSGGGLHSPTNPGKNEPAKCIISMKIDGDKFARAFPERDSEDATEDGYYCPEENAVVTVDVD